VHVIALLDCDQALRAHMFREVLQGITRNGEIPRESEKVLALLVAPLNAVLFGCAEPGRDPETGEPLRAGERPPVEVEDEGEPRGGE